MHGLWKNGEHTVAKIGEWNWIIIAGPYKNNRFDTLKMAIEQIKTWDLNNKNPI